MSYADNSSLPPAPPASVRGGGCLKAGLIGCGVLIALLVVLVVAGGLWWNRNRGELVGGASAAARDGARFGLVRDEAACFEEGKRRAAEATDFQGTFAVGAFVRSCLEFSRPTPGYCDNVPPVSSIGRSVAWQAQRCGEDGICRNVSQVVQTYCNEGRPKRPAADTMLMDSVLGRHGTAGTGAADTGTVGSGTAEVADSSSF